MGGEQAFWYAATMAAGYLLRAVLEHVRKSREQEIGSFQWLVKELRAEVIALRVELGQGRERERMLEKNIEDLWASQNAVTVLEHRVEKVEQVALPQSSEEPE